MEMTDDVRSRRRCRCVVDEDRGSRTAAFSVTLSIKGVCLWMVILCCVSCWSCCVSGSEAPPVGPTVDNSNIVCPSEWLPPDLVAAGNLTFQCCTGWHWDGTTCVFNTQRQCTRCFPCIIGDICSCVGGGRAPLCQAATPMCGSANSIDFNTDLEPAFNSPFDSTDWLLEDRSKLETYLNITRTQNGGNGGRQDKAIVFDSTLRGRYTNTAELLTAIYTQPPSDCQVSFQFLMTALNDSAHADNSGSGQSATSSPPDVGQFDVRLVSGNNRELIFSQQSTEASTQWTTVQVAINASSAFQLQLLATRGASMLVAIDNIQFDHTCCASRDDPSVLPPSDQPITSVTPPDDLMPDLEIDGHVLHTSLYLDNAYLSASQIACSISENCLSPLPTSDSNNRSVPPVERRSLLRFTTTVWNNGEGVFRPPRQGEIPFYHQCHNHYHSLSQFADYQLLDEQGVERGHGHKASFCLLDSTCRANARRLHYLCTASVQGISPGCADVYDSHLDCQWIDMTNLATGCYQLTVSINPDRAAPESNFSNNAASVIFFYDNITAVASNTRCMGIFDPVSLSPTTPTASLSPTTPTASLSPTTPTALPSARNNTNQTLSSGPRFGMDLTLVIAVVVISWYATEP